MAGIDDLPLRPTNRATLGQSSGPLSGYGTWSGYRDFSDIDDVNLAKLWMPSGSFSVNAPGWSDGTDNRSAPGKSDSAATTSDVRQAWLFSPEEMLPRGCFVASTEPIFSLEGGGGGGGGAAPSAAEGDAAAAAGTAAASAEEAPTAYSVIFETTIGKLGIGTRRSHFRQANSALSAAMDSDAEFAAAMKETGIEVSTDLSKSPANFCWHHVPDRPGTMQLVPRTEHQGGGPWRPLFHPGGVGGFKLWGSDY